MEGGQPVVRIEPAPYLHISPSLGIRLRRDSLSTLLIDTLRGAFITLAPEKPRLVGAGVCHHARLPPPVFVTLRTMQEGKVGHCENGPVSIGQGVSAVVPPADKIALKGANVRVCWWGKEQLSQIEG